MRVNLQVATALVNCFGAKSSFIVGGKKIVLGSLGKVDIRFRLLKSLALLWSGFLVPFTSLSEVVRLVYSQHKLVPWKFWLAVPLALVIAVLLYIIAFFFAAVFTIWFCLVAIVMKWSSSALYMPSAVTVYDAQFIDYDNVRCEIVATSAGAASLDSIMKFDDFCLNGFTAKLQYKLLASLAIPTIKVATSEESEASDA